MKHCTVIYFLLLLFNLTFGQESKNILYCNDLRDTIFKVEEVKERDLFYNLISIENIDGEFVFRSWEGNSCVEIIQNNNSITGKIHFATQKYSKNKKNKTVFTKSYEFSKETADTLLKKIKSYTIIRRPHQSGMIPVVHTFIIKQDSEKEIYTTDNPKLQTLIFNIIPMKSFLDMFENDIPFKKYVDWNFRKENKYYITKYKKLNRSR
ncbi:hypothetical protein J2X31_003343 [Flavobacterium arsenatis]|uniref:Uncharacterized protein n=1 Tax=Flavobacterium arsenatis TaxID=1484332 RepID=A0ABU1TTV5_9FLAO|nr:hypothetical protein [Flavobacterium arsenatis]MDR6969313.1 hypothetical protein [Flavobacterium arsenatis]